MRKCAVLVLLWLVVPGALTAARADATAPVMSQLGHFIPSVPPQPAPAISFTDLAGKSLTLADFRGKLVLVNLWATWCGPCREEMPSLERLQEGAGDKLTVLAISEDHRGSAVVAPFVKVLGLDKLHIYLDPTGTVGAAFGVGGLPTSFLVDRQGQVVGRVVGATQWDSRRMLEVLRPFLTGTAGIVLHSASAR